MEERRKYPRYKFELPVSFFMDDLAGEGFVHNLSQEGCLIESDRSVETGTYLSLKLSLSDRPEPLEVELAAVRWVQGRVFGVQLLFLRPEDDERLRKYIETQGAERG